MFLWLDFNYFFTGPWISEITYNNPKNGLKLLFLTKSYLLIIVVWERGGAHKHAIYLVISTVYSVEEAFDLRLTNTIYRQASNHKYKIMRLRGLCKWFLREFVVGKMWIFCWGYGRKSIFERGLKTERFLMENSSNIAQFLDTKTVKNSLFRQHYMLCFSKFLYFPLILMEGYFRSG